MRKHLSTLLKISVTLIALAFVITQVDLGSIWQRFLNVDIGWLLVAFALFNVSFLIRAWRWLVLLRGLGQNVAFWRLVALYFVGNFFNTFLPSGLGGDVVRAVEVAQDVTAGPAAGTVIVDRATGLLTLLIIGLLAMPFRPAEFSPELTWQITAVCAVGTISILIMIEGSLVRTLTRRIPTFLQPLWVKLESMVLAIGACGWSALSQAIAISFIFNFIQIAWWAAAGLALGFNVPLLHYFLVTPIMAISILMPSIGGLGVRESIAPLLFASAGLTAAEAVALSLLVFAIQRFAGLLGGPVYLVALLRRNREAVGQSDS